jgi:hypothetical protein
MKEVWRYSEEGDYWLNLDTGDLYQLQKITIDTEQDLFDLEDDVIKNPCPKCKADLDKVVTCGLCGMNKKRERAFPENHKFDINKQWRKIDLD